MTLARGPAPGPARSRCVGSKGRFTSTPATKGTTVWPTSCGPREFRRRTHDKIEHMQELIRQLLVELGEDPAREGLVRTPLRVEKALKFLTSGYDADIDKVLNDALFTVDYNEMVIVKDIDFYSLCEHHLLPFFGKCQDRKSV